MNLTPKEQESRRLKRVYKKILSELEQRESVVNSYKKNVITAGRELWQGEDHVWEHGDVDAAADVKQSMDILTNETRKYRQAKDQLRKLARLKEVPYFGRMDFIEEDYDLEEQIYIGTTTFFDQEGDILVYDWRAPVSSMFYDYGLRQASYRSPGGTISGEITLKRQYKISGNELLYMFDTGIKIDDDLLQELLSENTDEKMHNIVTTIQEEQNLVIRDEDHQLIMLQGVAGSGKTSIALHRIAYLLYRYRDSDFSANNILIFSPNTVFNDYISHVLPELGEENMQQTTFDEYMGQIIGETLRYEDSSAHMEFMLLAGQDHIGRLATIEYKSSLKYFRLINEYIPYIERNLIKFNDISFGGRVLITKKEIEDLFYINYGDMPIVRRLKRLGNRLHYLVRPARQDRLKEIEGRLKADPQYEENAEAQARLEIYKEFRPTRQQIAALIDFDSFTAYANMLNDEGFHKTLGDELLPVGKKDFLSIDHPGSKEDILGYEDVSAYVYLKGLLEGLPPMNHIKHVVVDEAQDYTPVQYGILKQVFPNTGMTLLGDLNQTINPLKADFDYKSLVEVFKPKNHMTYKLTKGYRSTLNIVDFTRHILEGQQEVETIERSGKKPLILKAGEEAVLVDALIRDIKEAKDKGYGSIGLISKTAKSASWLYDRIKQHVSASLITRDDKAFKSGLIVLPVYLAKGLEFDVALVYQTNEETYGEDKDRRLLYTACTRALHRLSLYHTGPISPLLKGVPEDSFEEETIL
ncbi:MAG TPA: RNA polymerase recycling motor HelD [Bacillota bacterium]|nr:RNA polymerase recycling motor HelD [Bacillota bacterium]